MSVVVPVRAQLVEPGRGLSRGKNLLYIGHAWNRGGWSLPESKWSYSFPSTDAESLGRYEEHVRKRMWDYISELSGQILGCWCPQDSPTCHGNILIRLFVERFPDASIDQRKEQKEEEKEPSFAKKSKPRKRSREARNQMNRAAGIVKSGDVIPWPSIDHEWNSDTIWIDEAGMGSWAGPLHVTGTILLPGFNVKGIHDSKLLTLYEREQVYAELIASDRILFHTEIMTNADIDRLHLGGAWKEAIRRIIAKLYQQKPTITRVVLDGTKTVLDTVVPITPITKADRLYAGVAAASIIAKVTRDQYMTKIAPNYPEFIDIFGKGCGYAHSTRHKQLLEAHQYTDLHRKSFDPLKTILYREHQKNQEHKRIQSQPVYRLQITQ
jgi:ribonuclease HII